MLAGFHFVFRSDTSYTSWQFAWQCWVNLHLVPWLFRHVSTLSLAQDVVERVLQSLKEDVVEGEQWRQTDRQWCLRELFTVCFYFCCKDLVFFQTPKNQSFISGVFLFQWDIGACWKARIRCVTSTPLELWSSVVHRQEACSGARPPVGCWGNPSKTSAWAGFRPRSTSTRRITGWTAVVNAFFANQKHAMVEENMGEPVTITAYDNCVWLLGAFNPFTSFYI